MHLPPPPDARELLPPLLACLPTAFISPRPPPALLPLLSPLLRQRVAFLGAPGSNDGTTSSGWLPLLTWDSQRAAKLPPIVERIELEPHPVSGELEIEDVRPAKYRRLDVETLQARLEVEQFELLPLFVWCESDEHAGGEGNGAGWKLAELRALEDAEEDAEEWFGDIVEANEASGSSNGRSLEVPRVNGGKPDGNAEEEDDDDAYWASYDRTPGRGPTPAKQSPAPGTQATGRGRSQSELEYYSRYGAEVQPALDAHDPDEEHGELGESTLNGDSLVRQQARQAQQIPIPNQQQQPQDNQRPLSPPNGTSMFPADPPSNNKPHDPPTTLDQPRPISPTDSQSSIERLEQKAAAMSSGEEADRAQTAIKQHISTDIKSLFRLARGTGMERREFERVVKTELECLGFLEENE